MIVIARLNPMNRGVRVLSREYAKKGQWSQVICAPVVVAYRVGHAFFGPMRLCRRATWDAALPGAGGAGFTLPRVIGR